jgi:hypothetical protein
VLNDFLRTHPDLLDNELVFLWKCKGLIDFQNKVAWFHRQINVYAREAQSMGAYVSLSRFSICERWRGCEPHCNELCVRPRV